MKPWRLLQIGSALDEQGRSMLERAAEILSRFVPVTTLGPQPGGLVHEAGHARLRALSLVETLADGAVAVLANGPMHIGMRAGDAPLAEILPYLPATLSGTVVGAISHAHVLTILSARYPGLRVLLGPPVVEAIGGIDNDQVAAGAANDLVNLVLSGPRATRFESRRVTTIPRIAGADSRMEHAPYQTITPVAIRTGTAEGRVIAGNLLALGSVAGGRDWPDVTDAILLCEIADIAPTNIARGFERLRMTRALQPLGALLVGLRVWSQSTPLDPDITSMLVEITANARYPVMLDTFVGSGIPSPLAQIGARASIIVSEHVAQLAWRPVHD